MAANVSAFRNAFVRLSFSVEAATYLVETQGLNSIQALQDLDAKTAATVCKAVRRPGGAIAGPHNVQIPNPGVEVSIKAESNLILLAFWARHLLRVSRTAGPADITDANIRSVKELMEDEEKTRKDPEKPTIERNNWF
jgi:hypothetical protein